MYNSQTVHQYSSQEYNLNQECRINKNKNNFKNTYLTHCNKIIKYLTTYLSDYFKI